MGVFDDTKLEQLDWMTQITETIDSDLNHILAKLPERINVTAALIIANSSSSYLSLTVSDLLRDSMRNSDPNETLGWEEERILQTCYAFDIHGEPELDVRDRSLRNGVITLVKHTATLSDEVLQPLMGKRGVESIGRGRDYDGDNAPFDRMNEIMDVLGGCQEAMKNRSAKKKIVAIKNRLNSIFATNEWRIRDMNLANKVGYWIKGYLANGNLADLTNLCKLKVMTHNNMPIYSIKEEK